ncbi:LppM family (lipo)protein [Micromonospora echinaurantiaca]|uniref:LppM family (lipo)protein n=1 Tax=Micromonospora echinaurantiaca TaxID=47857 RepID=UPI00371D4A66
MELNMGLAVNADDTVSGQLLLTARKTVLTSGNRTVEAGFAELRQNIPALPPGEETRYEDGRVFGFQITYRNTPLSDFNSESVKLVRDGDLYRFTLPLDPKKYGGKIAEQHPQSQQDFLRLMSFEISVTFPGPVRETNGTVNGRSVSWQVGSNQNKPAELRAVAEAPPRPSAAATDDDDAGGFPWLLVVGGVVGLLVVAVVVVLLLRRRPAATAPAGATAPGPTSGGPALPGQPGSPTLPGQVPGGQPAAGSTPAGPPESA